MNENEIYLSQYRPKPQLCTPITVVEEPRFPVIDAHTHLGPEFGGGWSERPPSELLDVLDQAGVVGLVGLDGGWGEDILHRRLDTFKAAAPERFRFFGGVDFSMWSARGNRFGEWAANRFRQQVARGADGLKIWKPLGLSIKDPAGELIPVDDERLDPIWRTVGELGLPVIIHVADPVAFFDTINPTNERWEELAAHPDWHFPSPPYPAFMTIMEQLANLVARHPNTTFIAAHVGCYAENLQWVGDLLDRCPNFYVDIAARIAELGRQPYTARRFFLRYADRILFGSDLPANVDMYQLHYRFLETDDEYFDYSLHEIPPQGRWQVYGVFLPDDVLKKVYYENAARLMGFA